MRVASLLLTCVALGCASACGAHPAESEARTELAPPPRDSDRDQPRVPRTMRPHVRSQVGARVRARVEVPGYEQELARDVDTLLRGLMDRKVVERQAAIAGLAARGPRVLPIVLGLLHDEDLCTRLGAIAVLRAFVDDERSFGPWRAEVVDALFAAAAADDEDVRWDAGLVIASDARFLPALRRRVLDAPLRQRFAAVRALAQRVEDDADDRAHDVLVDVARSRGLPPSLLHCVAHHLARQAYAAEQPLPRGVLEVDSAFSIWALGVAAVEEDEGQPTAARRRLGLRREEAAAVFSLAASQAGDPDTVWTAVLALGLLPDPPVDELVLLAREAAFVDARYGALGSLAAIIAEGATDSVRCAVRDVHLDALCDDAEDDDVRWEAASGLDALAAADPAVLTASRAILARRSSAAEFAAWVIGQRGPSAADAADDLARCARDAGAPTAVRLAALEALVAVTGCKHHPCVLDAALDPSVDLRRHATGLLADAPATVPQVAQALLRRAGDPDAEVRRIAVAAVGGLTRYPVEAAAVLLTALEDPADPVVSAAAASLPKFRATAEGGARALEAALLDGSGQVRIEVVRALDRWGDGAIGARPALVAAWRGPCTERAAGALLDALHSLGWVPERCDVPHIVPLLPEEAGGRGGVALAAIELLGRVGPEAAAALPRLLALGRLEQASNKERIVHAVGRISPGEPETVAFLVQALRGDDHHHGCTGSWDVPAAAARALGGVRPVAWHALPELEAALGSDRSYLRRTAAAAIGSMTGAMPELPVGADEDDPPRRW